MINLLLGFAAGYVFCSRRDQIKSLFVSLYNKAVERVND